MKKYYEKLAEDYVNSKEFIEEIRSEFSKKYLSVDERKLYFPIVLKNEQEYMQKRMAVTFRSRDEVFAEYPWSKMRRDSFDHKVHKL